MLNVFGDHVDHWVPRFEDGFGMSESRVRASPCMSDIALLLMYRSWIAAEAVNLPPRRPRLRR